ncbi:DUF5329 family protein [Pontibacter actiniarum]|uniref:DUF5329 domain-containing protein n=1 Tax=Pontibacter actiniarum TaxID=323450 RepID=A0A1X9YXC4_9BACT|nr:DUF5329 family protein [Pontibacter actiniarum]ARS37587.1 hypothetical protein CA264_20345 [Pontibacter actiniarum]
MKTKSWRYAVLPVILAVGIVSAQDVKAQITTDTSAATATAAPYTEEQKVNHLIQVISKMEGATFIRNGSEHTCAEAAEHLESKWEKHKDDVQTAQGFVEKLASRSGLTGEPYRIRFADGTEKTTNEVLMSELQQVEQR